MATKEQLHALKASAHQQEVNKRLRALKEEEERQLKQLPSYVKKLTSGYEMRVYAFEIFECFRKLALVGVPIFIEAGSLAQATYGLLVCFITFGMCRRRSFRPRADSRKTAMIR